jgi:peptide-methionine (R)-S-oxide reductase
MHFLSYNLIMTEKTNAYYKEKLSEAAYQVTRFAATEQPFSGEYCNHDEKGTYHCICCDAKLFSSDTKFQSHCGWPSFTKPLSKNAVEILTDTSHDMIREEALCRACCAHLGHRFPDGPPPLGIRFCINSVSLNFKA